MKRVELKPHRERTPVEILIAGLAVFIGGALAFGLLIEIGFRSLGL